jgi:hypothetical protein
MIEEIIKDELVEIYFQPIVSIRTKRFMLLKHSQDVHIKMK